MFLMLVTLAGYILTCLENLPHVVTIGTTAFEISVLGFYTMNTAAHSHQLDL